MVYQRIEILMGGFSRALRFATSMPPDYRPDGMRRLMQRVRPGHLKVIR
ncbi:hypothetical protein H1S01_03165 [Heliobacterium chlorum]|uniref:Uncharacterized protein n=1 Tax=Heliobacterium chlorum TaxID=2698 RepID=A0ABR7SYL1_HELCL|nr:hypothetical protein [Heliobacterium chlorum]MBC9783511.1 hypothetical protein [Heliobacterium chlorum]